MPAFWSQRDRQRYADHEAEVARRRAGRGAERGLCGEQVEHLLIRLAPSGQRCVQRSHQRVAAGTGGDAARRQLPQMFGGVCAGAAQQCGERIAGHGGFPEMES
jgi:hypothetical protein